MPSAVNLAETWITRLVTRGRRPALILLGLLTLVPAAGLMRLQVENGTASMISLQPQQAAAQERLQQLFGNDEDLLLSVTRSDLLSADGLALLDDLSSRLAGLAQIRRVASLLDAFPAHSSAAALMSGAGADPFRDETAPVLKQAGKIPPHFLSADHRTAGLLIIPVRADADGAFRDGLIEDIRRLMDRYRGRAELHLTGTGLQKSEVARYIRSDQKTVLPLVVLVFLVLLTLCFRHPAGVLLPLGATGLSLIWTMGGYAMCGYVLNPISSLLPPVIMILAMSNSVHLYNGWLQLDGTPEQRMRAWPGKIRELLVPCTMTAVTTALGLLSLSLSRIPAVRQFGLFGALGVILSLLISMILVPVGLSFLRPPQQRWRQRTGLLQRLLHKAASLTTDRPGPVLLIAAGLFGMTLPGLPQLRNNTNLIDFFHENAPISIDTRYIDQHLTGVNNLEFLINRTHHQVLGSAADWNRIARFAQAARKNPEVAEVLSILPWTEQSSRLPLTAMSRPFPLSFAHRSSPDDSLPEPSRARHFISADRKTTRITLLLHNNGSRQALAVVRDLRQSAQRIFGSDYQVVPTGSYYRLIADSDHLVTDLLHSFALSLFLVMLLIALLLRSRRLTVLAVLPNLLPILGTLGLMGWFDIDLSTGTAMIGAVAFGLAVDDTLHYLVHYRRLPELTSRQAVTATTTSTGRALALTTLLLASGFWTGGLGHFRPTVYFSLLVGMTLVGALLCDLLVLPAALVLWARPGRFKDPPLPSRPRRC